ncbi:MAG: flagellar motor switch protein FliG [Verrucomicrobiota bacterium]
MAAETTTATSHLPTELTRPQKLAVLLCMLGPDSAAQVLKHFDEREMEGIINEMGKLELISHELQHQVLREFASVAVEASTSVAGGAEIVRLTLEKAVGQSRAASIVGRAGTGGPQPVSSELLRPIIEADSRELFNAVKTEHPQTIALMTSYLPAEKASSFLNQCPVELRDKIIERLAMLQPTPIEVIEKIVAILSRKLGVKPTRAISETGGIKSAATLLNALERTMSKTVLTSIEERNPDLSKSIRAKMFMFEDMVRLDSAALQKVMREVDTRDLAVSLKKASYQVKAALLGAISKRAAETVKEEIGFLGNLKQKEIEAAQTRIVDIVRRLEGEGEIDLNPQEEKVDAAA